MLKKCKIVIKIENYSVVNDVRYIFQKKSRPAEMPKDLLQTRSRGVRQEVIFTVTVIEPWVTRTPVVAVKSNTVQRR